MESLRITPRFGTEGSEVQILSPRPTFREILIAAHDQPPASFPVGAPCATAAPWSRARARRAFHDRLVQQETLSVATGRAHPACWQEPSAQPGVPQAAATRSFLSTA